MHPHLHSVKPPIEIHTFSLFVAFWENNWKMGHRWTWTVRALPWVQEGLLPHACLPQTTGMCLSDHAQLCFFMLGARHLFTASRRVRPSAFQVCHWHVSPPVLTSPTCASCLRRRLTQYAWSNAGLTIFRATYLGNTPTPETLNPQAEDWSGEKRGNWRDLGKSLW